MLVTATQCSDGESVCTKSATRWINLIGRSTAHPIVEWKMCDEHAERFLRFLRSGAMTKSPEWQYLDVEEGAL